MFLAAHLEDIHGGAYRAERRDEEDHELLDVDECCRDKLEIEGCWLEKAKPIKNFQPENEDGECGNHPDSMIGHVCETEQVFKDDENCCA